MNLNLSFKNRTVLLLFLVCFLTTKISFGQVTIAQQDFEDSPATPSMTFNINAGTVGSITPGYPANAKTSFAGSKGYYVSNNTAIFTSNSDFDTRCYSSPSLSFKLAALDRSHENGLDSQDYVVVSISTDSGVNFSDEMTIKGNSSAIWSYTSGVGVASSIYDGNATVEGTKIWSPSGGSSRTTDGYATVVLTGLPNTASLRIKITLKNNSTDEVWAIDNVILSNSDAVTNLTTAAVLTCIGGSGSMTINSSNCSPIVQTPMTATGSGGISENTSYNGEENKNITINFPSLPSGAVVTSTVTMITYKTNDLLILLNSSLSNLRVRVTPPITVGGVQTDIQPSTTNAIGTLTTAFGTWGNGIPTGSWLFEFRQSSNYLLIYPDEYITNITITVNYTMPATIDWYTTASGGIKIGSGTSFNPVGIPGSGLPNTNNAGTTTFYTACSSNATCRTPTDFVVYGAPTVTQTIVATCAIPTGTIAITGVAGLTYNLDGGDYFNTLIYSGLAQGSSHSVHAKNAAGCVSPVANITIASLETNIWTAGLWSILPVPNANQNIEFKENYSNVTDVEACSCLVTSGVVIIPTGKTLKLGGVLTVSGGSITFKNNASLLQTNYSGANSGPIKYERETTVNRNTDFTYWSSPVVGQTLYNTSPLTLASQYFSFNATTNSWNRETATTKVMTPGIGYIIRGSETHNTSNSKATDIAVFQGQPNNGNITVPIAFTDPVYGTSNLIGNPYPSAIYADKFLVANSTVIDGTLYFWTHNTAIQLSTAIVLPAQAGTGALTYTSDDYASYNGVGGVSALIAISGVPLLNNSNIPNGNIAAGTSFFTTGIVAGNATFTNDMRIDYLGKTLNNSQFFKISTAKAKTAVTLEKDRIWLNLSNNEGAFKQMLVGYVTDATNDYDSRFDGESLDGNDYIDFYSVLQNKNLVIQGRVLPFDENDTVPLGFRSTIAGDFTINIDQVDGLLTDQAVFIEDKLTNTITDLKSGNYTFNTAVGTFNDRLILLYTSKTLGTKDFTSNENKVLISIKNKQIKVKSFAKIIDKVTIYDLLGRQIYQKNDLNSNELSIADLGVSHQVLVVKTTLQNGKIVSDKIIY